MWKMTLPACLLAPLISSCSPAGPRIDDPPPPIVKVVDNTCAGLKPILVNKGDVLTDDTAKQILAYNVFGEKKCGWKPKTSS